MATKNKPKIKFNIFDFIILLLVVLCIAAIVLKLTVLKNVGFSNYVKVNFVIEDAPEFLVNHLTNSQLEQVIYLDGTEDEIGTITNLSSTNTILYSGNERITNPTTYTISGEATLKGLFKDDSFLINGEIDALIGKEIKVFTNKATFTIKIVSFV